MFGFKKATVLAALSLFLSSAIVSSHGIRNDLQDPRHRALETNERHPQEPRHRALEADETNDRDLRTTQDNVCRLRETFNRLVVIQIQSDNVLQDYILPNEEDDGMLEPILMGERYPEFKNVNAYFSKNEPKAERISFSDTALLRVLQELKKPLSLGFSYNDPWTGVGTPWNDILEEKLEYFELPLRPLDFMPDQDTIKGILTRGPFSTYSSIEESTGDVILDFSEFSTMKPREPFVSIGGIARVTMNDTGNYTTKSIEFDGTEYTPEDEDFPVIQKRFLAALCFWTIVIDHSLLIHIVGAQNNALAVYKALPADHHLRILINPFITETTMINNRFIDGLLDNDRSNFPSYTGFDLETLASAMSDVVDKFNVTYFDPIQRYTNQGLPLDDENFPTVQSTVEVFNMYLRFTEEWCNEFMTDGVDSATKDYVQALDDHLTNGVLTLVDINSIDELTVSHVAHIVATFIFTGSVWHYLINDLVLPYFLTLDKIITAVDENGNPTEGVVLERRNSAIVAAQQRYYLLKSDDQTTNSIEDVLPDPSMKAIWSNFVDELNEYYEVFLAKDPEAQEFLINPYKITSSTHA